MVWREGRVLRRRRLEREPSRWGAGGGLYERGDQLAVWHALLELVERVSPCPCATYVRRHGYINWLSRKKIGYTSACGTGV
jgi:hypothetical protein